MLLKRENYYFSCKENFKYAHNILKNKYRIWSCFFPRIKDLLNPFIKSIEMWDSHTRVESNVFTPWCKKFTAVIIFVMVHQKLQTSSMSSQ